MSSDSKAFDFGVHLRKLRKEAKLTQEQLARQVGISRSTLYRYESSQNLPDSDSIIRLATALHTTTDHLLGLSDALVIRVDHLDSEHRDTMYRFIQQFIDQPILS